MIKKYLHETGKLSVLVLFVLMCISCAHQKSSGSAALDAATDVDGSIWSENKNVDEVAVEEEAGQQSLGEEATPTELAQDVTEETVVTASGEAPVEPAKEEAAIEIKEGESVAMVVADNKTAGTDLAETTTAETVVTNGDVALANIPTETVEEGRTEFSTTPNSTVSMSDDVKESGTASREPSSNTVETPEAKVENYEETNITPEPTVGTPSTIKRDDTSTPRTQPKKRSANEYPKSTVKDVPVKSAPVVEPKQDIQAKNEVAPKVAPRETEESFGHEPIPGKVTADEETPELASVTIANFIERHVWAVLIGVTGFMFGLYWVLRRNKENDNTSI